MKFLFKNMLVDVVRYFFFLCITYLVIVFLNEQFLTDTMHVNTILIGSLIICPTIWNIHYWGNNREWILSLPIKRIHIFMIQNLIGWIILSILTLLLILIGLILKQGNVISVIFAIVLLNTPFLFGVFDKRNYTLKKNVPKSYYLKNSLLGLMIIFSIFYVFDKFITNYPLIVFLSLILILWIATFSLSASALRFSKKLARSGNAILLGIYLFVILSISVGLNVFWDKLSIDFKKGSYVMWKIFLPKPSDDEILRILTLDMGDEWDMEKDGWADLFLHFYKGGKKIILSTDKTFDLQKAIENQRDAVGIDRLLKLIDHSKSSVLDFDNLISYLGQKKFKYSLDQGTYLYIPFTFNDLQRNLLSKNQSKISCAQDYILFHPSKDSMDLLIKTFPDLNEDQKLKSLKTLRMISGDKIEMNDLADKKWKPHLRFPLDQCDNAKKIDLNSVDEKTFAVFLFCMRLEMIKLKNQDDLWAFADSTLPLLPYKKKILSKYIK